MNRPIFTVCFLVTFFLAPGTTVHADEIAAAERTLAPVTAERLAKGTDETASWLMYGGNYENWRYSPMAGINRENVKRLQAVWMFQTGIPGQLEAAPVIADGILYLTASYNNLYALDAVTGENLWHYTHEMPSDLPICCGPTNRGVAIADDKVYMATLDARLLAFDRLTGEVLWNVVLDDYKQGYSATGAPLVVKGKVMIGIAGGEYGARGFLDAFDAATGERVWRAYTIPAAGEPGVETWAGDSWKTGGGPPWVTGSYDPVNDLLFWATGNPSPDWNGDARAGDNLYTNSVLALDPDSGEMKWYFQYTPHDVWDYDATNNLIVIDTQHEGQDVRAVVQPNRNGYVYVLDAKTGKFLQASQYVDRVNWAKGIDDNGRPIVDEKYVPMDGGNPEYICPGNVGGNNGSFTYAYSAATKLMYVPTIESCSKMEKTVTVFVNGQPFWGGGPGVMQGEDGSSYGHISAIDPATGEIKWRYEDPYPFVGGALATAGGLVFSGDQLGYALAIDDTTGQVLWKFQTGSPVRSQPVTYAIGGRQYVAIGSGGGGLAVTLVGEPPRRTLGSTLVVFALPE